MSPQLADSEFSPVFRLLTIFAYGTYADYLGEAGPRGGGGAARRGVVQGPFPLPVVVVVPRCGAQGRCRPSPKLHPFAARAVPLSLRPNRRPIAIWARVHWCT